MPSVNRQSLREELDTLKGQFERLSATGKVGAEIGALVQALLMLLDLVMAIFMEKTTTKNSNNSGIPPSQTDKDDTTPPQTGAKGKAKKGNDERPDNIRTVETKTTTKVDTCATCGRDLGDEPCHGHERRTLIDILFEKVEHHVDAEIKECPDCHHQTKGTFPKAMAGPLQYGPGIKAFILNLLIAQMLSLKRVQQSIMALMDKAISEATILNYVMQLHLALEAWEQAAVEQLLSEPAIHVDETSLRVEKKKHWIHVYSGGTITLKFLHPKRGQEAIEAIGIIPRYGGVVIHDCWASYLAYAHCGHGLCGSHLLRELTFIVEANGYAWALEMKRLLRKTCATVAKRKNKRLIWAEYKALRRHYRNILKRGEKELPPIPPRQNGKRGRIAKSDAHNLWERMKKYEEAILLFAKEPHVAFTNNRAERDLRMSKVKQKISGCFRTERFAKAYCRISSYLQTMANQGYNPLVAIQMALSGEIYAQGGE
jgi:transposase